MINENENLDSQFNMVAASVLKNKRLEKGYSLEEVVNKMNNSISRQSLFKYENNESRIKIKTFEQICKALNLDPGDVIDEIAEKTYISNYIIKSKSTLKGDDFINKTVQRPPIEFLEEVCKIINQTFGNNSDEDKIEEAKISIMSIKEFTENEKTTLINMVDYFHNLAVKRKEREDEEKQ